MSAKNCFACAVGDAPSFPPEPTTAHSSVSGRGARFVARWLRRRAVSGGCGSAQRSSMARHSFRASNPKGWQRVAGGRSVAETPGGGVVVRGIPEGCQRSATPPGSLGHLRWRSGGVATLNHRTIWQAFGLLGKQPRDEHGGFMGRRESSFV